jgi:hypothetical protein
MSNSCYKLIDIAPEKIVVNTHTITPIPDGTDHWSTDLDVNTLLTPGAKRKLSSRFGNLFAIGFSIRPNVDKGSIHIDLETGTLQPFWPSLNVVTSGQGVMRWFKPAKRGSLHKVTEKRFYKAWFSDYGEPIDEWATGKVALVKTDIAHQVWNFDNEIRQIISIRWANRSTWEETVEWFDKEFKL